MHQLWIGGIICAVIIVICVLRWNQCAQEDYLYGFWTADGDQFCDESEIDSMLLFIGEPDGNIITGVERACYIIIMNGICSQEFTMKYRPSYAGPGISAYSFDFEYVGDDGIWPCDLTCTVDMREGTMRIHGEGKTYALLNKQHDITNITRGLIDADMIDV